MLDDGSPSSEGQLRSSAVNKELVWRGLYEEYHMEVRGFLATYVRCPHDVDDLVQDVFMRVVRGDHVPRGPQLYIRVVARNRLRSYWREKRHTTREAVTAAKTDELMNRLVSERELDPLEQLTRSEARQVLKGALDHLPEGLSQTLRLRVVQGLSVAEVARQLGCSRDALKKRLRRARRLLLEVYMEAYER